MLSQSTSIYPLFSRYWCQKPDYVQISKRNEIGGVFWVLGLVQIPQSTVHSQSRFQIPQSRVQQAAGLYLAQQFLSLSTVGCRVQGVVALRFEASKEWQPFRYICTLHSVLWIRGSGLGHLKISLLVSIHREHTAHTDPVSGVLCFHNWSNFEVMTYNQSSTSFGTREFLKNGLCVLSTNWDYCDRLFF